jgi:DNA (cytosine-5)-methyltransferase 1
VDEPTQTVATGGHLFLATLRGQSWGQELDAPLGTITAGGKHHALIAPFLTRHYSQRGDASHLSKSVSTSFGAVTTQDHHSLTVPPPFLTSYYGTDEGHPVDGPVPTIPTVDRHALVAPFVAERFGNGTARGLDEPLSTAVAVGIRHGLVTPFLVSAYGDKPGYSRNPVRPIDQTLPTLTAAATHRLAVPGEVPSVEECGFRMLEPEEIQAAMAFPGDYTVLGNKRDRVKQLGNAVTPPAMRLLVERVLATLAG